MPRGAPNRITKPASAKVPVVQVSCRGANRLRDGHVWIYRSDIVSADDVPPGALVGVSDEDGKFLGTALYSNASQIAIRLISKESIADFPALLRQRIREAISYREKIIADTDAYRLIFSEADFLPGLIVDRYNDILSLQILTQAMDPEPVRETIVSELSGQLRPAAVAERVEPRVRELEQLPPRRSGLLWGDKSNTIFTMNGVQFYFEALQGQKTGAVLDQRENYAAAARYAHGEALDVFCYHGGFALHLASRGSQVTGVDSSRPALEVRPQRGSKPPRD
jgi:23S rRNA (cytosine1962-C5)-methyltransferase